MQGSTVVGPACAQIADKMSQFKSKVQGNA